METKQDFSFGVIPVRQVKAGDWEVLLIHQLSHRGDIYWTFPKGHQEVGETEIETALRELREETGLTAELETQQTFTQQYSFVHNEVLVEKTVVYYLGMVNEGELKLTSDEVSQAKWCKFAVAEQTLTHDLAKTILEEVKNYLFEQK